MKERNFNVITAESVATILYNNISDVYNIVKDTYVEHDKKNTVNLQFVEQN